MSKDLVTNVCSDTNNYFPKDLTLARMMGNAMPSKNLCEVCGRNIQIDGMLECQECLDKMAADYEAEDWYKKMGADDPSSSENTDRDSI
jgi:hypothetical protein